MPLLAFHSLWFWRENDFKYSNDIFGMKLLAEALCFCGRNCSSCKFDVACRRWSHDAAVAESLIADRWLMVDSLRLTVDG
jgi:hypothetical protein